VITYNVMEDGRFRDDMPFFGGKAILKPNGKEGNANGAIIEKLGRSGRLACSRAKSSTAILTAGAPRLL
jgi:isoleucyl-tRNA synthetase